MTHDELSLLVESVIESLEALSQKLAQTQIDKAVKAEKEKALDDIELLRRAIYFRNAFEIPRGWRLHR